MTPCAACGQPCEPEPTTWPGIGPVCSFCAERAWDTTRDETRKPTTAESQEVPR